MHFETLPSSIVIILLTAILPLSCKSRMADPSELSSDADVCVDPKGRLDCLNLTATHATGGTCTQRFLNRLYNKNYEYAGQIQQGFGLWSKEENRVAPGTSKLKKMNIRIHMGRHKEIYDSARQKWVYTMEPLLYQRKGRGPETVTFEWEMDTMGAPSNIRTLLSLIRLGYYQSGKFTMNAEDSLGQSGSAWSNENELNERFYSDPVDFYGTFNRVLSNGSAEFQKKMNEIMKKNNFHSELLDLLKNAQISQTENRCDRGKWLVDEQFEEMVKINAEQNEKFAYKNQNSRPEDSFEELAARMFFRQFHFDFINSKVPFVGSLPTHDPFYTFSENTYWSFNSEVSNPFTGQSEEKDYSGNPHDIYFGDLVFLNNDNLNGMYERFIMASPTKLAINPFLEMTPDKSRVLPSNHKWSELGNLPQPTVLGRFINRDGAYNKLIFFLKEAENLAQQKSRTFRRFDEITETLIKVFSTEGTGAKEKISELLQKLDTENDEEVKADLRRQMTQITAESKLDFESIRQIVAASRIAYWNHGEDISTSAPVDDPFLAEISRPNQSELQIAKQNGGNLLNSYVQAIISKRPASALPIEDIRIMKIEIIPTGVIEIDERNLYQIKPGKGTYSPETQKRLEE